jgi:hypothetical protein
MSRHSLFNKLHALLLAAASLSPFASQSAPIDQQNINKLPPALLRRYDVYVHAEKRIPAPDKELNAPAAAAANGGKAGAATHEHPITPLRRVAAQHIGKLVRVRVRNESTCHFQVKCLARLLMWKGATSLVICRLLTACLLLSGCVCGLAVVRAWRLT